MEKRKKMLFTLLAGVALVVGAALLLRPVLFPVSFPEASGTLSMVSLTNPKSLKEMERYIDLSKLDDDTWEADARGEEAFLPYGMIYQVETGQAEAVKGHGVITDCGLAYNMAQNSYYGVLKDPEGSSGTICTFSLEEGQNEFPKEFKPGEVLYSNESKDAYVYKPLLAGYFLYFTESEQDAPVSLCRYDRTTGKKDKLAEDVGLLYGVGAAGICYSAWDKVCWAERAYFLTADGEVRPVAKNAAVCGRSSNGKRALLRYSDEKGESRSAAVYDCDKGAMLSEFDLKESWGRLITGAVSPDSRFVAACFETGTERYRIRMIDTETNRQITLFGDLPERFFACCFDWS